MERVKFIWIEWFSLSFSLFLSVFFFKKTKTLHAFIDSRGPVLSCYEKHFSISCEWEKSVFATVQYCEHGVNN